MIEVYVNSPDPVEVETAGVGPGTYFTAEMPLQLSGGVLRLLLSTLVEEGSQLPVTADAVAQALKNYTPSGGTGEPGQDGFSPTVNVVAIDGGHRVTITDKDGDHVFDVLHGKAGYPGDSITIVSVTESTEDGGVNEVTFSDGTRITIKNGSKGDPGHTPEKGTDYYTEADKAELLDNLKAELPANGFSGSWNDLTDRPFGEEVTLGDTLTWDGNTNGLISVANEIYLVSENTPTPEEMPNGFEYTVWVDGEITTGTMPYEYIAEMYQDLGVITGEGVYICYSDNFELNGFALPKAGIYFMNVDAVGYVTSLTIPGYGKFETETIKTIDPKYLPDSVKLTVTTTEKFRIEYDGNPDNKDVVALGTDSVLVKLSDEVYPEEVWIGGTITTTASGSGNIATHTVVEEDIVQDAFGPGTGYMVANTFAVITGSDPDLSTGVWLVFPASLWERTKNHTLVFEVATGTTVTKIDPKFIPDSVLMESEMGKIVDAVIDALPTAEGGSF